ncbi:hypothetical protein Gotur_029291 [Gossypium turneri]
MIPNQSPSRSPNQIPSSHIHMGIHIATIRIWRAMTIFRASQGANTHTSFISLDPTRRSTTLSARIHSIMGLLLVQVRRCQSSHMIFPLCLPHPHLRQMRILVIANTQNVTVDLR